MATKLSKLPKKTRIYFRVGDLNPGLKYDMLWYLPLHYRGLPCVPHIYFVANYCFNGHLGSLPNLAMNSNRKNLQCAVINTVWRSFYFKTNLDMVLTGRRIAFVNAFQSWIFSQGFSQLVVYVEMYTCKKLSKRSSQSWRHHFESHTRSKGKCLVVCVWIHM